MKNVEVAECFVDNALAYAKSGDMRTVIENLLLIQKLLKEPDKENLKYDWEDFQ